MVKNEERKLKLPKVKYTEICGEVIDLWHDPKIQKLNAELAIDDNGAPLIVLQDWTGKGKDIVRLHIQDALRLKAVIDGLIFSFNFNIMDEDSYVKEKYDYINKKQQELLKKRSR